MRSETITLAGQQYAVAELPMRQNAAWRKRVEGALTSAQEMIAQSAALELSREQARDVIGLIGRAGQLLLGAPDLVAELVFAYAPQVAADRARVLDEGYESELWEAFLACLRLAYPFGRALRLVAQMQLSTTGSAPTPAPTTLTS